MAESWGDEFNDGNDDDEALRLAIAMSLGKDPAEEQTRSDDDGGTIDLTEPADDNDNEDGNDDEDNDKRNSACVPAPSGDRAALPVTMPDKPDQAAPPAAASGIPGLGGLDRKKMEEERLARLRKRKASELGGNSEESEPRASHRQKRDDNGPSLRPGQDQQHQVASSPANGAKLQFPRGVVKKTWARGQPRLGDDITIEEVLQKDSLELAVLSSFQWDEEWLMSKLDFKRTNVMLIAFAADEAQAQEMGSNVPIRIKDKLRFCFPPMQTMGFMHSKLQLLKYKDSLRVVVPTGNLVPYDWGESGLMENMAFIIDLPKADNSDEIKELTPFGEELCYFLLAQGLDEHLVKSLRKYDFSETSRYAFVHTIGGSHTTDDSWKRTGYCGLGRAARALGMRPENPVDVDYVCSSIGSVKDDLLNALYYACQGVSGLKEYESRTSKPKGKHSASLPANNPIIAERFRVYFPSRDTVLHSRGGANAAGTICFQQKWWNSPQFPRSILRDCKSTRPGLLMHSKVMFVRIRGTRAGGEGRGFAYVGSANLSESAWGRLVKDRGTGKAKLTCRNWECGVLVQTAERQDKNPEPPMLTASASASASASKTAGDKLSEDSQQGGSDTLRIFEGCIPIPMQLPGKPLVSANGTVAPWFFLES